MQFGKDSHCGDVQSAFPAKSFFDPCLFYHKIPKYSDTQKFAVIILKIEHCGFTRVLMCPNNADGMVNSEDPDQTAPLGAVWSGFTLFAQTCLSKNLGQGNR